MTFTPVENLSPSAGSPPTLGSIATKKLIFLAKRAIQLPPANHNALPLQGYIPSIRRSIRASWQSRCDQCVADGNKLTQLKTSLDPWFSCSQRCHRLEIFLFRLRIAHILLTHGYLMAREAHRCQVRLSVFHVLVECPAYYVLCNRFFPFLTSVLPREHLSLLLPESPTFSSSTLFAFFVICAH